MLWKSLWNWRCVSVGKTCGCQSLGMTVLQDSWTKNLFVVCVISSDHPCFYVKINSFNEISSPGVRAARSKCWAPTPRVPTSHCGAGLMTITKITMRLSNNDEIWWRGPQPNPHNNKQKVFYHYCYVQHLKWAKKSDAIFGSYAALMLLSKRAPLVAREGGKGVQVSHFSPDNQALLQNRWTLIIIRSEWGGEGWCKGLVLVNGDAENDDDHYLKKAKV